MDSLYSCYYCYVVKPGVFAGAAVLSLISHCPRNPLLPHLNHQEEPRRSMEWQPQCSYSVALLWDNLIPPTLLKALFLYERYKHRATLYMIIDYGWFWFTSFNFWLENYKEKQIKEGYENTVKFIWGLDLF
ncbi:hypothetical protein Nepgr_020985 [Nepenthes gracilis]|uniref:Uncharacterized protein n=1 Tax=Nepenthes gracilis TaxID=150966 RepID=A0AAD3SYR9_NEPGR|nr:hypothetical protein Nepgr_020985 [Nepenthes gracilis]